MPRVTLILFEVPPLPDERPLTALLSAARRALAQEHVERFLRAGVDDVVRVAGRGAVPPEAGPPDRAVRVAGRGAVPPEAGPETPRRAEAAAGAYGPERALSPLRFVEAASFGEALARVVHDEHVEACVVLGDGAVPRLRDVDAERLVQAARSDGSVALTNNRFSSDVCAVSHAETLQTLPALPSDNALPRWLEEVAGYAVRDLAARDRLALDLDTPLDLALLALAPDARPALRRLAVTSSIRVPRAEALRAVAADPRRELLVFGRSSSATLGWLERHVRCRVRFLAEERGMRAASPLAMRSGGATNGATGGGTAAVTGLGAAGATGEGTAGTTGEGLELRSARARGSGPALPRPSTDAQPTRPPRATLGRLLDREGPDALPGIVSELADAAVLDTRVLLADRMGPDEDTWPAPEDRFASDLLLAEKIADPWLRSLTAAVASAPIPILLGGHTLVGPGVRLLLRGIR